MKADPEEVTLPCLVCDQPCEINFYEQREVTNSDIKEQGYDKAVVIHTYGNYGSQVHDMYGMLSFVICDFWMIQRSDKMLHHDKEGKVTNARDHYLEWKEKVLDPMGDDDSYKRSVAPYFKSVV